MSFCSFLSLIIKIYKKKKKLFFANLDKKTRIRLLNLGNRQNGKRMRFLHDSNENVYRQDNLFAEQKKKKEMKTF